MHIIVGHGNPYDNIEIHAMADKKKISMEKLIDYFLSLSLFLSVRFAVANVT
jgi:hypothetical protein